MASLEALTNEELHRELLKHGFPNMPVTSTTRKVLVKKLQLKLDNGTAKSNRRETIDVTKFSSDEEPEEVVKVTKKKEDFNRRRTVGGEKLPSVAISAGSNKRRSGRVTPLTDLLPGGKRQTPVPVPEFGEESDEDEIRLVIEHRPPSVVADRRSKSKSPSLGKSDTVTTSYKHVPAVPTIPESPIIIEDEFEEPDDEEDDYEELEDFVAPPPPPPKVENRYQPATRYSELGESSMADNFKVSHFFSKHDFSPTDWQKRRPITVSGGGQTGSYDFEEPLLSKSSTSNFASPSFTGLSSQSRYSASTYRPSTGADAGFAVTAPEIDLSKSPYLSSFTRRLSNLKVDPLDSGIRTRRTYGDRPAASRRKTDTLWDNVKHVVLALHRKYKVHFSILLVALVLLLIFVVFFM
jgi:LEM domain